MLLRAKKIEVIFSAKQSKSAQNPSGVNKVVKDFKFFSSGRKKKIKIQRRHSSLHKNDPISLNKMLISGLVEEKQTKRKARALKTARNVPLF